MQIRQELYIKSLYFSVWMAIGSFWPFIYVYYNRIGLSATTIGLVIMAGSLAGILAATAWGMLNDRLGQVRLLLAVAACGAAVVCQLLGLQRTAAGVILAAGLFAVFTSPILPLLDSTTLALLAERPEHYGSYRAWGTIGFIAASASMGVLIDRAGLHLIFWTYGAGLLAFGLLAQRLPGRTVVRQHAQGLALRTMVRRPDWLIFAASIFVLWFAVMGATSFLGIVITQTGGTQRTVGLAATVAALTEYPFFRYSPHILRRLGPSRLLALAMGVYCLRLVLWGIMPDASWAIGLALLQGVSYGPFLVGLIAYTDRLAPQGLKTTAQGLTTSVLGLSNLAAGLAGGWLLDHTGRQGLYFSLAGVCLAALALFALGWLRTQRLSASTPLDRSAETQRTLGPGEHRCTPVSPTEA